MMMHAHRLVEHEVHDKERAPGGRHAHTERKPKGKGKENEAIGARPAKRRRGHFLSGKFPSPSLALPLLTVLTRW